MKAYHSLLTRFYNQYITPQDQKLLDLVFVKNPSQQLINAKINDIDIEILGANKALLLDYFLRENPGLHLNNYTEPRVHGCHKYFHFRNTKTIAHLSRLGKALNQVRIPFVLFKGGAMKALRPDCSRPMGDTDILLPKGAIKQAVKIGENLGYQHIHGKPTHAVGLHTETEDAVDLHYHVFDDGLDLDRLEENIFKRSKPMKAFGIEFLMPCHEDLFFLVLNNFTKNLREKTTLGGIFYALLDAKWLLQSKPEFDFAIVRENSRLGAKELETRFAADIMNRAVPGLIPDIDSNLPYNKEVSQFSNELIFEELVFRPLFLVCQAMRVAELRNYPGMNGKRIIKYLIFNRLRKKSWFLRWYLNNRLSQRAWNALR